MGDGSIACPPDYVCTRECPAGQTCSPPSGGGGDGGPPGARASNDDDGGPTGAPVSEEGGSNPGSPSPDAAVPPASSSATALAYDVVDAKMSAPLSSLVLVSDQPANALHLYNVSTGADEVIALLAAPKAVALDLSGLHAAVAYDAHVSLIDLQARAVTTTCDTTCDASDVALATTGIAYITPAAGQMVPLHAVDLGACTETISAPELWGGGHLSLHPSETVVYASLFADPPSIDRCDLTVSPPDCQDAMSAADWDMYGFANAVWSSADGTRVYTGGPATLLVPPDPATGVCKYGGSLEGVTESITLSEAPSAGRVALILASSQLQIPGYTITPADTIVRVYETQYLSLVAQYAIPTESSAVEHGVFVFSTPTMDALYVVADEETPTGDPGRFSILTMIP